MASMPSRPPSASSSLTLYAEFSRARARLVAAREEISTAAISGAVGTFANIDPRVEAHVAAKLGLKVEPISTQVIPRDRHAAFFAAARRRRLLGRAAGDRDPPPAAHRSDGGRGILRRGPEGLVRDAPQAQSGAGREPHRPRPHGALGRHPGARGRGALARARHLAFLGRADDRPRRDDHPRFRAGPACRA